MKPTLLDNILKVVKIGLGLSTIALFVSLIITLLQIRESIKVMDTQVAATLTEVNKTLVVIQSMKENVDTTQKELFQQMAYIERNLFKRVDSIENKLFTQTEEVLKLSKELKTNADVLTAETQKVSLETTNTLQTLNKTIENVNKTTTEINEYMDCESNSFCWPNLIQDTALSIRNVAQDANKTYLLINESIPVYNQLFMDITKNVNDISKNVARITKPKWYDRILSTTIAGAAIYASATK